MCVCVGRGDVDVAGVADPSGSSWSGEMPETFLIHFPPRSLEFFSCVDSSTFDEVYSTKQL